MTLFFPKIDKTRSKRAPRCLISLRGAKNLLPRRFKTTFWRLERACRLGFGDAQGQLWTPLLRLSPKIYYRERQMAAVERVCMRSCWKNSSRTSAGLWQKIISGEAARSSISSRLCAPGPRRGSPGQPARNSRRLFTRAVLLQVHEIRWAESSHAGCGHAPRTPTIFPRCSARLTIFAAMLALLPRPASSHDTDWHRHVGADCCLPIRLVLLFLTICLRLPGLMITALSLENREVRKSFQKLEKQPRYSM